MITKKFLIITSSILAFLIAPSSYAKQGEGQQKKAGHHPAHVPHSQAPTRIYKAPAQVHVPHSQAPVNIQTSKSPTQSSPKSRRFFTQPPHGQQKTPGPQPGMEKQAPPITPPSPPKSPGFFTQPPQGQQKTPAPQPGADKQTPPITPPSPPKSPGFFTQPPQGQQKTPGSQPGVDKQTPPITPPSPPKSPGVFGATGPTTTSSRKSQGSFRRAGKKDSRRRDFFRNQFQKNFSFIFGVFPIIISQYYTDVYYPEPYYPDYIEHYYTDYSEFYTEPYYIQQPYGLEEYYYFDEFDDTSMYSDQSLYLQYQSTDSPYAQNYEIPTYKQSAENPEQQPPVEMLEIQALLQSVLRAMKIFDISFFYNDPKLSVLKSKSSL